MTRPVSILFVAGSLGGGGAERQLIDLIVNLDRTKFSPRLYLSYRRGELLPEVPADVPIDAFWDGQTQRSFWQRMLAKLRCPSAARALHLREVIQRDPPDVIMSWSLRCSYEAAGARSGSQIPQIAMVLLEPAAELVDAFPENSLQRRRLGDWTYRTADCVVSNSSVLSRDLINFYQLPATKVHTWLNSRDFDRIDRHAARDDAAWPLPGKRIVVTGRLAPQKGFDALLQAIARLDDTTLPVQVAILGQGPDETSLKELAAKLEITDRVRFLGFQANPFAYYRTADVFVLSSRFEGLPNALIEAMACRVPVIATDCPTGPREILDGGKYGRLIPVDDVDSLAEAIRTVLSVRPSPEELNLARQSVLERFGIAAGLQRFEEILQQTVSRELSP